MIFFMMSLIQSKNVCLPGSSMCEGNSMHVCDINSKWVIVECPDNTVCKVQSGALSCIPTSQEENDNDNEMEEEQEENANDNEAEQEEEQEENDDCDENEEDTCENTSIPKMLKNKLKGKKGKIQPKKNSEKTLPKESTSNKHKNNLKIITKTLVRDDGSKSKKSKNGKENFKNIIKISNNKKDESASKKDPESKKDDSVNKKNNKDEKKENKKKENNGKDKEDKKTDDKKKEENGKSKDENGSDKKKGDDDKNIKTVTVKASNNNEDKKDGPKTVTVTTTMKSPQKKPEEIQLEYTNGQSKNQAQPNVNMNELFKLLQEIKKNGDQQKMGPNGTSVPQLGGMQQPSGMGGSGPSGSIPQGGGAPSASSISSSGSKPSGGGSTPSSGGNGAQKPSGGSGSAPSGGGGGQKPSGGGGSTPSSGGNGAQKPSGGGGSTPSGGGGGQKPSGGGGSTPSGGGNGAQKPSGGGGGSAPSGGGGQKPSGGEGSKPPGGGDQKPSGGGGGSAPSGGGGQKPSGGEGSKPSGGGDSKPSGGGGGVDKESIKKAVEESGYSPNPEYLDAVAEKMSSTFDTPDEAAMFLAQIIHESAGLTKIEEEACVNGGCEGQYGSDQGEPGKSYHGRGFIQLTWPDNYKAASEGLGMGDELYKNPEKVSQDPNVAMDVSVWFWQNRVANEAGVKDGQFGATTKAINGPIECSGGGSDTPQKRYDIYTKVAQALGVQNLASPDGC